VLDPVRTWGIAAAYRARARALAAEFSDKFESTYGGKGLDPVIAEQCPGT